MAPINPKQCYWPQCQHHRHCIPHNALLQRRPAAGPMWFLLSCGAPRRDTRSRVPPTCFLLYRELLPWHCSLPRTYRKVQYSTLVFPFSTQGGRAQFFHSGHYSTVAVCLRAIRGHRLKGDSAYAKWRHGQCGSNNKAQVHTINTYFSSHGLSTTKSTTILRTIGA